MVITVDVMKFITDHYAMFYELIGLLIILFISAHIPPRMKLVTRISIALLAFSAIVHGIEEWTQTFETLSGWRVFLTGTKYSIYPLILWSLIEIVHISLRHRFISNKWRLILLLPEIIMIPIYYSSQASHLVFYYTVENNLFHAGPLSLAPYILFAYYILIFITLNIILLRNYSLRNKIIACYIPIGAAISVILFIFVNDNPDYNPIFTSSLVLYYLFVYIHIANVDTLTGLLNRQSYYNDMISYGKSIDAVVSIDMNDLKYLNDTFGHEMGDTALKDISSILIKQKKYRANVYRVGGDEFCIFYYDITEEKIKERILEMKEELSKTQYTCAFGYSMKENNLSVKDMINLADIKMYIDKKAMKEKLSNSETK